MKKILALCLMIALAFGAGGATCKGFLTSAEKEICNPPPNVIAMANLALPIFKIILETAVPGSAIFVEAAAAVVTVDTIQRTGCTTLTALNQLIALLGKKEVQDAQVVFTSKQILLKKGSVTVLDAQPFIDWSKAK